MKYTREQIELLAVGNGVVCKSVLRQLLAENDALREDAERYRFLRSCTDKSVWDKLQNTMPFAKDAFDKAIDAARKK